MSDAPRLDFKFTPIKNEVLEAIYRHGLPATSTRVVLWIARQSYGWRRKRARKAGYGFIGKEVCMAKSSVKLALAVLIECRIVNKDKAGRWGINKRHKDWKELLGGAAHRTPKTEGGVQPTAPLGCSPLHGGVQPTAPFHDERKKELKKEKKKTAKLDASQGPYEATTDLQRLMCAYKELQGFNPKDREWDRTRFAKNSRAAKELLKTCGGLNRALQFQDIFSLRMKKADLTWTMAAVARNAADEAARQRRTEHQ